jgi:1,4-dihydroxy-2-naphthoyl-CoA hydrolase
MDAPRPDFPTYDEEMGEAMVNEVSGYQTGLPSYLGITFVEVGPGRLTCELMVTEELLNPFGAAHGGVISALVDHCLGAVCAPVVERGTWPATSEYKLNLLAPGRVGVMRAASTIVAMSRRTAVVRVDVTNGGRLVGVAQGTVALMPPRTEPAP